MSRPEFSAQISLGNIITIAGGIMAFAFAWANLDNRLASVEDAATANAKRIEAQQAATAVRAESLNERLRLMETLTARQEERWLSVQGQLNGIQDSLNRLTNRLDGRP